uniref:Uncharacterized protein n=1 Tax=Anguilla anguilla TaxID=7936 RepID=A0A0E9SLL0_ANGAN
MRLALCAMKYCETCPTELMLLPPSRSTMLTLKQFLSPKDIHMPRHTEYKQKQVF